MPIIKKSAEPFSYKGENNKAVLLVHGFTGAPTEMEPLGRYLNERGYSVYCPLLAGHGTTPEDMENTNWKQWVSSIEEKLKELQQQYNAIHIVGFSMGGCITLYLSMKYMVNSIVTISAPIHLVDRKAHLTPVLKHVQRFKDKPQKPDYGVPLFSYDKTPIKAVPSLLKLIALVKKNIAKVKTPILVIQGDCDKVVLPKSADFIYKNVSSETKEIKYYPVRSHMITVEKGRQEVFAKIDDFLEKIN